jgi:hypothetical protein
VLGSLLAAGGARAATPLDGDSMWIWVVARSSRGDPDAIVRRAHQYGIESIVIKGADGRTRWWQFDPALVAALKAGGLRVCAYQFVYGRYPRAEAAVGARLSDAGADCLMIDAEGAYEGRYFQAQTYLRRLRALVGPDYPVGLAGFPYVHYHPGYPYSVFLGPDGAQFNMPQMYWRAIGVSVDRIYDVTYRYNAVYGRPVFPLGQVYGRPPTRQIRRFRQLALLHGAAGASWWVWQVARRPEWRAVGALLPPLFGVAPAAQRYPLLRRGSRGDLVVWAQLHLASAGEVVPIDGIFGGRTRRAVRDFQLLQGLPPAGVIGPRTWQALLRLPPAPVTWRRRGGARLVTAAGAALAEPRSASLPARRDELGGRRGR